jgi:MFS family permease
MGRSTLYYYVALGCIACAGIPKGYDEGGFSASTKLPSFISDFDLNKADWVGRASALADRKANISSFGVLGAAFGSLIGIFLNDRIGRLRSYQLALCVWAVGILMQIFSSGIYGFMLFARIFGGLGAGSLTVTAPLFLAEIATAEKRGLMVSLYMVVLLSFLTLGECLQFLTLLACFKFIDIFGRFLHQLCRRSSHGSDTYAVQARTSYPSDPHWYRFHLLLVAK